jgi:glycosyltransferase involved in cell wall biosynthesis
MRVLWQSGNRMSCALSVVLSTYNRSESLAVALRSLRAQEVPPGYSYEVIVVDNNCTDDTPNVVRQFQQDGFDHLHYVHEPRQGLPYGRNAGVAHSRAPVVAFFDDDLEADRTWVATIQKAMQQYPDAAGIGGRVLPRWPEAVPGWLARPHWAPLAIQDYGNEPFSTTTAFPRCLVAANLALRRDALDRIGGFSTLYPRCQDHELQMRLWRAGEHIVYVPEVVVYSPIDPERLTKAYHRRWHSAHGWWMGGLQLEESIDGNGVLLHSPLQAPLFLGVPAFVFRDLLRTGTSLGRAWLTLDRTATFERSNRLRYLVGYIKRRAHDTQSRPRLGDFASLCWHWFRTRRRRSTTRSTTSTHA